MKQKRDLALINKDRRHACAFARLALMAEVFYLNCSQFVSPDLKSLLGKRIVSMFVKPKWQNLAPPPFERRDQSRPSSQISSAPERGESAWWGKWERGGGS